MYKISVIGTGYVGLISALGLASFGSNVLGVDIDEEKIDKLNNGIPTIFETGLDTLLKENLKSERISFTKDIKKAIQWADIIFIAVGTPEDDNGDANISYVYNVAESIKTHINGYKIIVTKSTVPVGTNEQISKIIEGNSNNFEFDIASNPEFLREGRAIYDFFHPDRIVIGSQTPRPIEAIKKIYRPLYLNEVAFVITDLKTAELIKYASNCFLATKIAFINEIARLADVVGANVQTVALAMGKDGRIGSKFLHPGPGYGGSCFPKDTKALAKLASKAKMPLNIIETVIESNIKQKEYVLNKIISKIDVLKNPIIAVLGLAFKSETDDIRDSAAIYIIEGLIKVGIKVKVFDPKAMENARMLFCEKVTYCEDEYSTVKDADAIVILTEWNQFRLLNLQRIKDNLKGDLFFDFRNIYKRDEVQQIGLKYVAIGI